jgi:HPt (histidine-containing phosphotransfer) domain-containing protein
MTPKSDVTILQPLSAAQSGSADFVVQWSEARNAYPLYAALATQFNFGALPYPAGELPPQRPTREVFDSVLKWLDGIDGRVRAFQIRQLPPETLNSSEQSLRAFLQRQLRKHEKTTADRDKIDLLLVQYFALCAPEELYRKEIHLEDVAEVLQPVLTAADATRLDWCAPLDQILDKVAHCESLRDMMELGLLEQGRLVKESAGAMFYDPAALVAFCRFNFLLRRAFIRMLHADLSAVRQAAETLDANGVKTVDCRRAGFSAAETTTQLRYYCENWKQPFHKDYTETSVTHAFEQLLALRADLEEALARGNSGAPSPSAASETRQPDKRSTVDQSSKPAEPVTAPAAAVQVSPAIPPAPKHFSAPAAEKSDSPKPASSAATADKAAQSSADSAVPSAGALDKEKCLESIWEQLIAEPPSRGRSMSTIVLQNTKVLLSSWEVAAFVAEGDQEAEDLRRAVVARALLAVAMEERKRSGDLNQLATALTLAKAEVSYFQGRVEQAKRAKNTEAAVNLGISTKRLLSFIEEAEKLQP